MKKYIYLFSVVIATLFVGCNKYDDEIAAIEDRLDKIEGTSLNTIGQQIAAINASLEDLKGLDDALQKLVEAKDVELGQKIANLETFVNDEITATEDWASATFATLAQYEAVQTEIAAIKELIETNSADIAEAYAQAITDSIGACETSMKTWVNDVLADGYYDIASVDAELEALEAKLADADAELKKQIEDQEAALEQAKSELETAYKTAIEEAVANDGIINKAIADAIATAQDALQLQIDAINTEITDIGSRLTALETNFANRIQSLTYIPKYTDGKATMTYNATTEIWEAELDFFVMPKAVIGNIEQSHLSVKATYTATRAASLTDLSVTELTKDAINGTISVKISGENLSQDFFNGTADVAIFLIISDGNSEFVSDYVQLAMGHTYTYDQASNTYTVYAAKGLYAWNEALENDLTANLVLAADITLPNKNLATGEEITVTDGKPSGSNWPPYGYYDYNVYRYSMYNGTIDGGGHTINGMRINMGDITGFVKVLGGSGSIRNLFINDVVIYSTGSDVAAFAGTNFGIIENCHVKGEASSIYGQSLCVGGIVGYMNNKVGNAEIIACSNMATVTSADDEGTFCGGVVGSVNYMGASYNLNVIGCWTKDTNESSGTKDGIGKNNGASVSGVFSVADATAANSKIIEMNQALEDAGYTYRWETKSGGWPEIKK